MAHKATHSWMEGKTEQSSTTGKLQGFAPDYIGETEDMLADIVAINAFGDPNGWFKVTAAIQGPLVKNNTIGRRPRIPALMGSLKF